MTPHANATDLADWAVDRWTTFRIDALAAVRDPDGSMGAMRFFAKRNPQVYAVSTHCQALIDQAAAGLRRDLLVPDRTVVEDWDAWRGKVWMLAGPPVSVTWGTSMMDLWGLAAMRIRTGPADSDVVFMAIGAVLDADGRGFQTAGKVIAVGSLGRPFDSGDVSAAERDQDDKWTAWVLVANAFVRQKLMDTSPTLPGRGARKRLAAERPDYQPSPINVVLLRAVDRAASDRAESEGRVWNCQWLVNGHNRLQFFPSAGEHRLIWISPYVKGPKDKPFVAKERRIAVVR